MQRIDAVEHPVADGLPVDVLDGRVDTETCRRSRVLHRVGGDDEHLARNTASVQARAAEAVGFDDGGAEMGEFFVGQHVAAARSQNHEIVMTHVRSPSVDEPSGPAVRGPAVSVVRATLLPCRAGTSTRWGRSGSSGGPRVLQGLFRPDGLSVLVMAGAPLGGEAGDDEQPTARLVDRAGVFDVGALLAPSLTSQVSIRSRISRRRRGGAP